MKQRIYIDTSIVGGFFDEEFKEATLELELIDAPQQVRELLLKYSADKFVRIAMSEEAEKLADAYITERVVGKTSLEDCRQLP